MRRRAKAHGGVRVPVELTRYDPADWPMGCHPECSFWAAVAEFAEAHPGVEMPHLPGPDAPWHPELI